MKSDRLEGLAAGIVAGLLALVAGAGFIFGAEDPCPCPVTVRSGDTVKLEVYWPHEGPDGARYTVTERTTAMTPGTAECSAEGHPVGARWIVNGEVVRECGDVSLFSDGFEDGTTSAWSRTTP